MTGERKSVYIETTIPSYATSKASRDLIKAHRQTITKLFWDNERHKYDLYSSKYAIEECSEGDPDAAKRRLDIMRDITLIPETEEIVQLAKIYFELLSIPEKAKADCSHLAVCVAAKIDYLLSWNCTHIGTVTYAKVYEYNNHHGLWTPHLYTPEVLMQLEEEEDELR
jgi:hypothetical protein